MDKLILQSRELAIRTPRHPYRYLYEVIDWNWRLIGIRGARGVGKTTLLLQQIRHDKAIYLSLDDIYFSKFGLRETVESLRAGGFTHFYLDEVHKYPGWAREIKNLYDLYPDIFIVFTGSSIIELKQLEVDLSRRALIYDMPGLSYREFLLLKGVVTHPAIALTEIIANHESLARELATNFKPLEYFKEYLQFGYYPYFTESKLSYQHKLNQVVRLILEIDLAIAEGVKSVAQVQKIAKLLQFIADAVPFKPNISNLAKHIELDRSTVLRYLQHLHQAKLIGLLYPKFGNLTALQKPEKIFLDNSNLAYALSVKEPNIGNIRETFFYNQVSIVHQVNYPITGDFLVDNQYIFEVGGQNKSLAQIIHIPDSFLAVDGIETGLGNKIPLWLFGFLY